TIFDLSDVNIVERSKYDMLFKFFLDMSSEESVIESSSLSKFRKLRIKDVNLLDMLINKTVEINIEIEVINYTSIIVDARHTHSLYNHKLPKEILTDRSRKHRKSVYEIDESMKVKFPSKSATNELADEIEYCQKLMNVIEKEEAISQYPKVKEKLNLLKETVSDDIEHLRISED